MKIFVIFNGPPGAGKTTLLAPVFTAIIKTLYRQTGLRISADSIAVPIKIFLSLSLGLPYQEILKDATIYESVIGDLTPRQLLIKMSEEWIKPTCREDFFVQALLRRAFNCDIIVIDDCGFEVERQGLEENPDHHVFLVHVYRKGCNFENDSRGYLNDPDHAFLNDGDGGAEDTAFERAISNLLSDFAEFLEMHYETVPEVKLS